MIVLITIGTIFIACNKETENIKYDSLATSVYTPGYHEILSVNEVSKKDEEAALQYLSGECLFKNSKSYNCDETIVYKDLDGKVIALKNNNTPQGITDKIMLFVDANDSIMGSMKHVVSNVGDVSNVDISIGEDAFCKAVINTETGDLISIVFAPNSSGGSTSGSSNVGSMTLETNQSGLSNGTAECIRTAIMACINDPACALMCGIGVIHCLAAITLSCAIHNNF